MYSQVQLLQASAHMYIYSVELYFIAQISADPDLFFRRWGGGGVHGIIVLSKAYFR